MVTDMRNIKALMGEANIGVPATKKGPLKKTNSINYKQTMQNIFMTTTTSTEEA